MTKSIAVLLLSLSMIACRVQAQEEPRVLVFSKTAGFRHDSIKDGLKAIAHLGKTNGFQVDATENSADFNDDNLKRYNAVIFLSTTGDVLDQAQQTAFEHYIKAGGGYVGVHGAADTEYDWPWYGKLVGGYFKGHPDIQRATVHRAAPFGSNAQPDPWVRTDEWYNYKNLSADIKVIFTLDETTYKGGENGKNHPIAWFHEYDGGRAFYTGMGHTEQAFSDPMYLDHLLDGIRFAIGRS